MNKSTYNLIVTVLVLVIVIGGGMLLYRDLQDDVVLDVPGETQDPNAELAPDFRPPHKMADSSTISGLFPARAATAMPSKP